MRGFCRQNIWVILLIFCDFDDTGRVIFIRFVADNVRLIFNKSYFSCAGSLNQARNLNDITGSMESVFDYQFVSV